MPISDHAPGKKTAASEPPFGNAAWHDDGLRTAAIISSGVAAVLGVFFCLSRWGCRDLQIRPALTAVGLSWLILHGPTAIRFLSRKWSPDARTSVWLSEGLLAHVVLALVAGLGMVCCRSPGAMAAPVAVAGAALLIVQLGVWLRGGAVVGSLAMVVVAAIIGSHAAFSLLWYADPLGEIALASGHLYRDRVFQAAFTNMLTVHGTPSTGLDGVPFIPYHFGSHWWLGRVGDLLGLSALQTYNLAYPVIVVPLALHSLVLLGITWWHDPAVGSPAPRALRGNAAFALLLIAGFVGVFPAGRAAQRICAEFGYNFLSESQGFAYVLTFLGTASLIDFSRHGRATRESRSLSDVAFVLVWFPTWVLILGLTKITSVAVAIAVAGWIVIRRGDSRRASYLVAALLTSGAAWLILRLTYYPGYGHATPLWWFRLMVVPPQDYPFVFLQYWFWPLAYVVVRLRFSSATTVGDLLSAIRAGTVLDVEVFVLATLVATIIDVRGIENGQYFFATVRWGAWAGLLGIATAATAVRTESEPPASRWRRLPLSQFGWSALAAIALATAGINYLVNAREFVSANLASRGLPYRDQSTGPRAELVAALKRRAFPEFNRILSDATAQAESRLESDRSIVRALMDLNRLGLDEKRRTALYIPKSNRAFWDLGRQDSYAEFVTPFIAPAVSGLAMIDGLPEPNPALNWWGYGYGVYDLSLGGRKQPEPDEYRGELLARAAAWGMTRIVVLTTDADGRIQSTVWEASPRSSD